MAQAGPMARTLDDLKLLWQIIVGPYAGDRRTPRIDWGEPNGRTLADYKIAWVDGWPGYETSQQISASIRDLVEKIGSQGATLENSGPNGQLHDRSLALHMRLLPQMIAQDVPRFIRPLMKRQFKNSLLKGATKYQREFNQGFKISFRNYAETMDMRAQIIEQWENFLSEYDFLICPISYGPAYKRCELGSTISYEGKEMIYINYAWPYVACFNASGHPAMNIPLGLGKEGLPLGVQIVGPYWSEPGLLHFANLVSQLTGGFIRPEGY